MDLDEHRVRVRAYYIWEDEGRVFGHAEAHWLRAESELRAGPAVVRASAEAVSLAPSPAKVLRTRAPRAKTTAEAVVEKAAKSAAVKSAAAKSAAAKSEVAKSEAAKSAGAKSAVGKPAAAKPAAKATAVTAAPKTAAPRTARKAPTAGVALH